MNHEIVLKAEEGVVCVLPIQDGVSDKAEGRCLREEGDCREEPLIELLMLRHLKGGGQA